MTWHWHTVISLCICYLICYLIYKEQYKKQLPVQNCDSLHLLEHQKMLAPCFWVILGLMSLVEAHNSRYEYVGMKPVEIAKGSAWPKPQIQLSVTDYLVLPSASFEFVPQGTLCPMLQEAISRYYGIIFSPSRAASKGPRILEKDAVNKGPLNQLIVKLEGQCEHWPHFQMDESYALDVDVDTQSAILQANAIWGILRGLETFSQLVYVDENGQYLINGTDITDFPRFPHRGILLDTSRHYLPLHILKENLDAMAYNKLNVFHWHIVDDQAFPYQSLVYPNLSDKGAYNPHTHVYSTLEVEQVIEYGRLRGIRVVPEFDTPGHTYSWGYSYPELLTQCYETLPNGTNVTDNLGPLNPARNYTYEFMSNLLEEVALVFPDKFIHLGADEVPFSCWQSNPEITAFMSEMGFGTDYAKLESYYISRILETVDSLNGNKSAIVWQEVVDNGVAVNANTIVEVWMGGEKAELAFVTGLGYQAILSSCWYLDHVSSNSDWRGFYDCEPLDFDGNATQKALVKGGEACLWGEFVDGGNVLSRLWPRASAVAERLWSDPTGLNPSLASPRFEEQRCRMITRGINAEPQGGPGYCQNDYLI